MAELPSGTVTFLFTDLEGSTRLWEEQPDAMRRASARHDELVADAIETHNGHVVKTTGDGAHAAFATASDAIDAALAAQLALGAEEWPMPAPLRVRIGIHSGPAELRDGDYYGPAVNRAARIMSVAHGGQVVISAAAQELARDASVDIVDLGEHRLKDLGHPEHMFQVVHPDLEREFPPLRSLEAFATNLPLQVTTFVGRDEDVDDVIEALGRDRLVTLIGVGGVGKTRLAVQTAAEVLTGYRDGVWLCELGPLSDPVQVPDAIATTLGVQQRPGQSMTESLVATLRSKEMLLVLDNCEHLLEAAARLVSVLVESCPGITVLATGREGLGVRGERMMMVRSLALPVEGATTDEILAAGAVQLFGERAERAGGGVDLDGETAATVAQLCRRLDGIPLAIELAAARTRMMSPQEIAARLDERFRLLTGGSRTAVERHQTLRRAVEWSYDLLDERERTVLDRLGVFAGGFTLDAAEAVVGDDDLDVLDVLDGVAQLVDKSLVVADRERHDTRYRLLETIRVFALERLDDAGATDMLRRRHATWCAGFIAEVSVGVRGPDEAAWLRRVHHEVDNIRAALTWATGADDADLALSLMGDFSFWSLNARRLGYLLGPWTTAVLATTGAAEDPRFGRVLALRVIDHVIHERYVDAEHDVRRVADLLAEGRTDETVAWTARFHSLVLTGRAPEFEGADALLETARAAGDDYTLSSALAALAVWSYALADLESVVRYDEEALSIARRIGNPTLMASAGMILGGALETTDPTRARSLLERALEHGKEVEIPQITTASLAFLVRMGADAPDPSWAAEFRRGIELPHETGDAHTVLMFIDLYAQALAAGDRPETGALLAASAAELAPHLSNPVSLAHRTRTNERLLAKLGEPRLAELTAQGAELGYEATVALALAELDRVIEAGEGDDRP